MRRGDCVPAPAGETEKAGVHCEWILGEQQGKVHFLGEQHSTEGKDKKKLTFISHRL